MYKKIFYLLTFILVGLIGCEKTETADFFTEYSEENLRKYNPLLIQTTSLCCNDGLPIILGMNNTPLEGSIGTYSCIYEIASVNWAITTSEDNYLASGNSLSYSNSFLLEENKIYSFQVDATLTAEDLPTKLESAIFYFIYSNGSFFTTEGTSEVGLCSGENGLSITAIIP